MVTTSSKASKTHAAAPSGPTKFYPALTFKQAYAYKRVETHSAEEAKVLKNQRESFAKCGFASIPDQGLIEENCPYLKEVKDTFITNYLEMKKDYDQKVVEWTKLGPPIAALDQFTGWQLSWKNKGLVLVSFDVEDNVSVFLSNIDSWDKFDFRVMKDIWQHSWPDSKKFQKKGKEEKTKQRLCDHLLPLFHSLRVNLSKVIVKQEGTDFMPVPTHITLMAGGTVQQAIHSDFLSWPGHDEDVAGTVPLSKWFGSAVYLFKDYTLPLEQPAVLLREKPSGIFKQSDGTDKKKSPAVNNEVTQQGFISIFSAHVKHAGGIHSAPNCRLHVYFDSTEENFKRSKDSVLIWSEQEERGKRTNQSRNRRLLELSIGKGETFKPKVIPGLYNVEHPKPSVPDWAEWNVKNQERLAKELERKAAKRRQKKKSVPNHGGASVAAAGGDVSDTEIDMILDRAAEEEDQGEEHEMAEHDPDSKPPAKKLQKH